MTALGHDFTFRQAADACGLSIRTLKRRRNAGDFPNAHQLNDGKETWLVPLADLLAAGLQPGTPTNPDPEPTAHDTIDLREQLHTAQLATKDAELTAAQTRIDALSQQVGMIEAATSTQIEAATAKAQAQIETLTTTTQATEQRIIDLTETAQEAKTTANKRIIDLASREAQAKKAAQKAQARTEIWQWWTVIAAISAAGFLAFAVLSFLTR